MSIAGKILAVFNLIVIFCALVYFPLTGAGILPADWGIRHSWAYSYFRHELILDGLPLDKDQKDNEGYLLVDRLSENTQKQIFQGLVNPVTTQIQEIDRVRQDLQNEGED